VRAAGSGIVAYAGNELKGYGNLVLIRHDGGWVTAYAHNKELFVNRGDSVNRGDVIANAGQTGSVTSPQVHFEVRKGATAVDPMKHLDTEQAMN
jgi:murein DD-endopeptidase MepM/ murein hydrolase activator NlpD